jgi:hypothetical protein
VCYFSLFRQIESPEVRQRIDRLDANVTRPRCSRFADPNDTKLRFPLMPSDFNDVSRTQVQILHASKTRAFRRDINRVGEFVELPPIGRPAAYPNR